MIDTRALIRYSRKAFSNPVVFTCLLLWMSAGLGCSDYDSEVYRIPDEFRGYFGPPEEQSVRFVMTSDSIPQGVNVTLTQSGIREYMSEGRVRCGLICCKGPERTVENATLNLNGSIPFVLTQDTIQLRIDLMMSGWDFDYLTDAVNKNIIYDMSNSWACTQNNPVQYRPMVLENGISKENRVPFGNAPAEKLLIIRPLSSCKTEALQVGENVIQELRLSRLYGLVYLKYGIGTRTITLQRIQ